MLSLERIYSIIEQTWGRTDIAPLKAAAFARAIEREATAEAVRIMREWVDAKDAKLATTWADYERAAMRLDAAGQAMRDFLIARDVRK